MSSPHVLRWFYEEAQKVKKYFIVVPKITIDHCMKSWKKTYNESVALLNQYSHGLGGWIYNYRGPNYVSAIQNLRKAGYTKQIWALGDDGNRPQYGGITVSDSVNTVNYLADRGLNFCLFNPKGNSTAVINAMKARYSGAKDFNEIDYMEEDYSNIEMPDMDAPCNNFLIDMNDMEDFGNTLSIMDVPWEDLARNIVEEPEENES